MEYTYKKKIEMNIWDLWPYSNECMHLKNFNYIYKCIYHDLLAALDQLVQHLWLFFFIYNCIFFFISKHPAPKSLLSHVQMMFSFYRECRTFHFFTEGCYGNWWILRDLFLLSSEPASTLQLSEWHKHADMCGSSLHFC